MAIIRKTSESKYYYIDLRDHTLDGIESLCPLDNGQQHDTPRSTLGALDKLPLELLNIVLVQLGIGSLTDFRRVNRQARRVIDSIPQYREIIQHAPATIRGILSIETGDWISCQNLYAKLCTAECDGCGDFGGYLYLITCRRVCFLCFTEKTAYLPLLRTDAMRKFGLRREHVANLPRMKSIPGRYSPREIKCSTRLTLIDHDAARQAGIRLHGSVSAMEHHTAELASEKLEKYQRRASGHEARQSQRTRRPKLEDDFDGFSSNPKRFMGIVRAPLIDTRLGTVEWGVHCIACKSHHYDKPLHWRRMFTTDSFKDHVSECGEVINGHHSRQLDNDQ
jgi:hypothetical protein